MDDELRDKDAVIKHRTKQNRDSKVGAKETSINVGDEVLMKNMHPANKLSSTFLPVPATVVEKHGSTATVETESGQRFKRNTSHLKVHHPLPSVDNVPSADDISHGERDDPTKDIPQSTNSGQDRPHRICATSKFAEQCLQLQRGNTEVLCVTVQDSIECAQNIRNGTADIGIFSAESMLQLATLSWDGLTVIKELRHKDRARETVDYRSVVVVPSTHQGGLEGLRGKKFCHPGLHYGRQQRWSERFLKYFERLVVPAPCGDSKNAAEIETVALSRFFQSACRPGKWSNVPQEDAELKTKYPNLCELCHNANQCSYDATTVSNHRAALDCLRSGGDVAYVSQQDAVEFFTFNSDIVDNYAYLCPNGTLVPARDASNICSWLTQPWPVIMSTAARPVEIALKIDRWMRGATGSMWESAIQEIIGQDSRSVISVGSIQSPVDYLRPYRQIPIPSDLCQTTARWCTTSFEEKEKCDVLRTAALTSGIYPIIECTDPATSRMACLSDIASQRADFIGIDSNFGFLARHLFNLTAAMFQETDKEKYSSVVVIVRDDSRFTRFENLRNAKACIPEFGGIASIAFINVGRTRGVFDRNDCNYGRLLGDFFSDSCAPGSRDSLHDPHGRNAESLCTLCHNATVTPRVADPIDGEEDSTVANDELELQPVEVEGKTNLEGAIERNVNCVANQNNPFYGTKGALNCLLQQGEVAIVEAQNLAEHARALGLDPNNYRFLCRNGTLAANTGFQIDEECVLTTIVDGEIVVRRQSSKAAGIVNALSSLDVYLQSDPDFKMYNIYNGVKNLLFEDSALGLVSTQHTELGHAVQNYIRLFENIEDCKNSAGTTTANPGGGAAMITINVFMTFMFVLYNVVKG
ncbi:transferrin-like [Sabethes cyaneus]|uniref:transferrin-like n=1 Tax=Sabethes cyaneus TaxID=53552 RepID=UPI00237ECA4C|nr:transferrin-like [Sabethes cyaneus]